MISADTTVAQLLAEHPHLVEVLAGYHPHFKQLRNRLLRRVMAPRVTVAQAARMAGVPSDELLAVLRRAVGAGSPEGRGRSLEAPSPFQGEARGEGLRGLMDVSEARRVHLDVREDIRRGQEPFALIMAAVKELGSEHVLVLRVPFEPIPLFFGMSSAGPLSPATDQPAPPASIRRRPLRFVIGQATSIVGLISSHSGVQVVQAWPPSTVYTRDCGNAASSGA